MDLVNYISNIAIPAVFFIIIGSALIERKKIFDSFIKGVKDGMEIVIKLFPTLLGLFVAIGALRSSGVMSVLVNTISIFTNKIGIPSPILPLAILRPISGSASIAVATDIMKTYGVDSFIGNLACTIMGSTETTIYTIAVYTGSIGVKKTRFILIAALIADFVGMISSVIIWKMLA